MRSLHLAAVAASHPGARVLHDVDLSVPSGATTAVLGPSGCGKTTLLRVVAGFMRPDAGTVRIGPDVVAAPGTWVPPERRGLGYVAQEGNLFPHLDLAGNIAYGLPRGERRDGRGSARVAELLELVGLSPDWGSRRPDQLSGGQQQRVALARALAKRPRAVLLDEPFSALDPELRVATRDAVAAALAHEGATVVLVTHDQGEALSFADQVAIMREGAIAQVGSPAEVYRAPTDRASALALGEACFLPGRVAAGVVACALGSLAVERPGDVDLEGPCEVVLRPEQLHLGDPTASPARAQVTRVSYFGHDALVELRVEGHDGPVVRARTAGLVVPRVGEAVGIRVTGAAHVLPAPAALP
jgi:iron(III) transport system ATP-binding protein